MVANMNTLRCFLTLSSLVKLRLYVSGADTEPSKPWEAHPFRFVSLCNRL